MFTHLYLKYVYRTCTGI